MRHIHVSRKICQEDTRHIWYESKQCCVGIQLKQMVGILMYVTVTRPSLMFVMNMISSYKEHLVKSRLMIIKFFLRYLKLTIKLGIQHKKCEHFALMTY